MEAGKRTGLGDLTAATEIALREMIDFLATAEHLTQEDSPMLPSIAVVIGIS